MENKIFNKKTRKAGSRILLLASIFVLLSGSFSGLMVYETSAEEESEVQAHFAAKDLPNTDYDELEIFPAAPAKENPQLLRTGEDDRYLDLRASFDLQALEFSKTHWIVSYAVYMSYYNSSENRRYLDVEAERFCSKEIWGVGIYHQNLEGYISLENKIPFDTQDEVYYKFVFTLVMYNEGGDKEILTASGYGYSQPEISPR